MTTNTNDAAPRFPELETGEPANKAALDYETWRAAVIADPLNSDLRLILKDGAGRGWTKKQADDGTRLCLSAASKALGLDRGMRRRAALKGSGNRLSGGA